MTEIRPAWRRHLTYANVLSTLAVFLVLAGGTAYAAGLRPGSVASKTVRNNSLTSADLANGRGVSGADLADGSLSGAVTGAVGGVDFSKGSLDGGDFGEGSLSGADIGKAAIGTANLAPDSVDSQALVDNSLQGVDFAADSLTGNFIAAGPKNINESTLAQVPQAQTVLSRGPSSFLSTQFYEARALRQTGTMLPDGTSVISLGCDPGDIVISGGAGAHSSPLVENRRQGNLWISRVDNNGFPADFEVHVICSRRFN